MGELNAGDLVLAKYDVVPSWPAKICRPEDFGIAPNPNEYLVKYFGTAEIRFVAPEVVQLFTREVKDKMSTRSRGKPVADIVQAIEEICTEFEELQWKNSCPSRKDTVQSLCNWSANLSPTFSDIKGNITFNSLKELALASSHSFLSIKERAKGKASGSLNSSQVESDDSDGCWDTGGSLNRGSEGATVLDAFKRMVETISRTKESIASATRLAIESAKHGIANEVVGLLVHELETEPSLDRRVNLFFLVDSITQCSHKHKGSCAAYIHAVQAALPRILWAAAPQGMGAHENRRQCLKVLRLWIERNILPEPLLRQYVVFISMSNDSAACGFSTGKPFVDGPFREIEGLLIDEYGSNINVQLSGLICSNVIKEDLQNVASQVLQVKHTSATRGNIEKYIVTQKDRRTCIMEDVGVELEMKDLSRHQVDERPMLTDVPIGRFSDQADSERIIEASPNRYLECVALTEGSSPPLPPGSPPKTPPFPSSPSPPAHTPLHPTFPPPPPSELHPFYTLPPRPPSLMHTQTCLPSQSSMSLKYVQSAELSLPSSLATTYQEPYLPSQSSMSLQYVQSVERSLPSSWPTTYQEPLVPYEAGSMPSGDQLKMAGNSLFFPSVHKDACINLQPIQPGQQFQRANEPVSQRHLLPEYPPQILSSRFSHPRPPVQQHPQHPYPAMYAWPKHPNGPEGHGGYEQSGMQLGFSGDYHNSVQMDGSGRSSGSTFGQKGCNWGLE